MTPRRGEEEASGLTCNLERKGVRVQALTPLYQGTALAV